MKKIVLIAILCVAIISIPFNSISFFEKKELKTNNMGKVEEDFDPLVDIIVTVEIKEIRSLETKYLGRTIDKIDEFSEPDFYVKVFINGEEFKSPV
ncbi:MAG TPA: hypothetical protein ENI53_01075 [Thermoplasmatales archaeon]|nr:hypothetical protein [Thermoplasmatales archaeon]